MIARPEVMRVNIEKLSHPTLHSAPVTRVANVAMEMPATNWHVMSGFTKKIDDES